MCILYQTWPTQVLPTINKIAVGIRRPCDGPQEPERPSIHEAQDHPDRERGLGERRIKYSSSNDGKDRVRGKNNLGQCLQPGGIGPNKRLLCCVCHNKQIILRLQCVVALAGFSNDGIVSDRVGQNLSYYFPPDMTRCKGVPNLQQCN